MVLAEHRCYLKLKTPKTANDKLIFFDFETDQSTGEHLVNYAVMQYASGETKTFEGYDACNKFCRYLFTKDHEGYTVVAHNMKGFDGQFIVGWLLNQGVEPEIIPNGSKLMSISCRKIRIIDSFNFLPMSLAKLPKTFGFDELHKGYFPHLFNRPENQDYIGELPPVEYFSPNSMSSPDRIKFLEWYEERKKSPFHFKKEMNLYCR